jgi:diadenosine tetraphosphatase ApaH/serine/threonine PP2A family protein phosphatase
MRLAILSDIHGNYRALQAVLEDIEQQQIDGIICLGDNIGYGPEPEKVVLELIRRDVGSVMGNHELALISPSYYGRLNFLAQESLDISRSLLSEESLAWLAALQPVIIRSNARFCHGCPPSSITKYLYAPSDVRLTRIFQGYPEMICFAGHTHMLNLFEQLSSGEIIKTRIDFGSLRLDPKNRYLFIVGSVGQPRDSLNDKAKYAVWDSSANDCKIRQLPYDVDTTIKLLKQHNFPPHNARRLKWSRKDNR